ncbi:lytic murein transglycosylase [Endothiovibrio diazotrophicus]
MTRQRPPFRLVPLLLATTLGTAACADAPQRIGEQGFLDCVADLKRDAAEAGIPPPLIARAFSEVKYRQEVVQRDRAQAEFVEGFGDYLAKRVDERRITTGKAMLQRHHNLLWRLYKQYDVPPQLLVALWGMETNYGRFTGRHAVIPSLATLSCDPRRSAFFHDQLMAALKVAAEGLDPLALKGSWAGALGHTQFMPTTWLKHAVDGDGDGRRDLLESLPDALASAANYLADLGWKGDQRWGREVRLPLPFPYRLTGIDQRMSVNEWKALGVTRADGRPLADSQLQASLLLPAGYRGAAFLVYDNFHHLLEWNRSAHYALAVSHLADRLMGREPIRGELYPERRLTGDEVREIQRRLTALGFDAGAPDGKIGALTRQATRAFQLRNLLPADGFPDAGLLEQLRLMDSAG